jgi:hypothetical protein
MIVMDDGLSALRCVVAEEDIYNAIIYMRVRG